MRSVPMVKCSSERWVCAPHSLSAGTGTSPRESCSILISVLFMASLGALTMPLCFDNRKHRRNVHQPDSFDRALYVPLDRVDPTNTPAASRFRKKARKKL